MVCAFWRRQTTNKGITVETDDVLLSGTRRVIYQKTQEPLKVHARSISKLED
jgi:hypothetical protein